VGFLGVGSLHLNHHHVGRAPVASPETRHLVAHTDIEGIFSAKGIQLLGHLFLGSGGLEGDEFFAVFGKFGHIALGQCTAQAMACDHRIGIETGPLLEMLVILLKLLLAHLNLTPKAFFQILDDVFLVIGSAKDNESLGGLSIGVLHHHGGEAILLMLRAKSVGNVVEGVQHFETHSVLDVFFALGIGPHTPIDAGSQFVDVKVGQSLGHGVMVLVQSLSVADAG
jgi:hypothetical protein